MAKKPDIDLLPSDKLFTREFQKDVEFFQLLILMISRSCVTGDVAINWVDSDDGFWSAIATVEAAKSPSSRYLRWQDQVTGPRFCRIVRDYGRHSADSCGLCTKAAEERAGKSGRSQVYRCHAGLTDIAVPVVTDGRHVATVLSGAVLTVPPSRAEFERIVKDVSALTYIDLQQLEQAYWEVPVVSDSDIENTVSILEVFAAFLARFWKHVGDTVVAERQRVRSRQLTAKEFAYTILQPDAEDRIRLSHLMKALGFEQPPNRVLVVQLQAEDEFDAPSVSFDLLFTAALHATEELAEKTKNMAVAYLRRHGVCVFFRDLTEGPSAGLRARPLAEKILSEISSRCEIQARVGIGGLKPDWRQLVESYHEACLALAKSDGSIALCGDETSGLSEFTVQTELACQYLADQRIQDARLALRALPMIATRRFGGGATPDHQNVCAAALESLCRTSLKTGCEASVISSIRIESQLWLSKAASVLEVHSVFLEAAEKVTTEIQRLLSGKHEKVISRVQQMLDRRLKDGRQGDVLSLAEAAKALGVSSGHLSRTFRRVTGMTFRAYVTSRRVELARRLLLEPLNSVGSVAERCGFSTPSYFARVFRKVVGCAPTDYANRPGIWSPRADALGETRSTTQL